MALERWQRTRVVPPLIPGNFADVSDRLAALEIHNLDLKQSLAAIQETLRTITTQNEELQADVFQLHRRVLDLQEDSIVVPPACVPPTAARAPWANCAPASRASTPTQTPSSTRPSLRRKLGAATLATNLRPPLPWASSSTSNKTSTPPLPFACPVRSRPIASALRPAVSPITTSVPSNQDQSPPIAVHTITKASRCRLERPARESVPCSDRDLCCVPPCI